MDTAIDLERYLKSINRQMQLSRTPGDGQATGARLRAVTLSRQAGAGAHLVAEQLIEMLEKRVRDPSHPWMLFDRDLVERVLTDHDLPGGLARFMPEDRVSEVSDTLDGLFGLRPSSWTLVRKTADTILHLAQRGNVVVIGRGANIITRKLDSVLHVRLVGSPAKRINYLRAVKRLSAQEASAYVHDQDLGRKRYVKKYFGEDIDDPLLYHLVINTDLVPYTEAARMIAHAVRPVA
jgi:hypothetical protein